MDCNLLFLGSPPPSNLSFAADRLKVYLMDGDKSYSKEDQFSIGRIIIPLIILLVAFIDPLAV